MRTGELRLPEGIEPYYHDEEAGIALYCGDCRDVLTRVPTGSIDMVVTDPPYSSGARRDADRQVRGSMLRSMEDEDWFSHDAMTSWGYGWFFRGVLTDARRCLASGTHVYCFSDWRQTPNIYAMLESCGYRVNHCLVWAKSHFGMGSYWRNQHENIVFASNGIPNRMLDRGMGSVIAAMAVSPEKRVHPTEKPLDLICTLMRAVPFSTVLDPFAGSGTTLVAAKLLGRHAIGIEIEPVYCDVIVNRLRQSVLPLHQPAPVAEQLALEER